MNVDRSVPSEEDWRSVPWGLDTPHAHAHFSGLTHDQAVRQLQDRPDIYWEDFLYMPPECLSFYMWAFIEHLKAALRDKSACDLSRFVAIVEARGGDLQKVPTLRGRCEEVLSDIDNFYREAIGLDQPLTRKARAAIESQ